MREAKNMLSHNWNFAALGTSIYCFALYLSIGLTTAILSLPYIAYIGWFDLHISQEGMYWILGILIIIAALIMSPSLFYGYLRFIKEIGKGNRNIKFIFFGLLNKSIFIKSIEVYFLTFIVEFILFPLAFGMLFIVITMISNNLITIIIMSVIGNAFVIYFSLRNTIRIFLIAEMNPSDFVNIRAFTFFSNINKPFYTHEWSLLCLNLRFTGWVLVAMLTLGIGGYWVIPYATSSIQSLTHNLINKKNIKIVSLRTEMRWITGIFLTAYLILSVYAVIKIIYP